MSPAKVSNKDRISLMIVGAQKAGTTSLKNYLGEHPSISTHPQKEFSYFFDDEEYARGYKVATRKYFSRTAKDQILIAKNAGLYVSEAGIKRLKEHNPDCKIVIILRNPVLRTYSSYLMEKNYGALHEPFEFLKEVAQKADKNDWRYELLLGMSIYYRHLGMIYRYFPKEQVRIIRFAEFESSAEDVCKDLYRWLGVSDHYTPDITVRHNETIVTRSPRYGKIIMKLLHNSNPLKRIAQKVIPDQSGYRIGEMLRDINKTNRKYKHIPPETADFLTGFFAPYNRELEKLTGLDFSGWDKPITV